MAREMKDSGIAWIGTIPKEWDTVKFKYLHNGLNTGESIDKDFWTSEENGTVFYTAGLTPIRTSYKEFPTWKYTRSNDILLARNGTPYVYFPVEQACYSDHIIRAAMKDGINRRFVQYCLQQSIASVVVDTVSIATWSASLWNEQTIPWPSESEQQRIVTYLDAECARIDAVMEQTRVSIEEYKKLKQAVITQAVTKGIRPNRPMKDSGVDWIGDIANDFQVMKLKYVCDILDQFRSPITADQRNQDAEILYDYYGASGAIDKIDGYTIDDHVMLIGEDGANLRMRNLPLMYEVNGKAWINNHAHILKPKNNIQFYYLFFALEALDINPYITGSAQPKLSQENLKNIFVPVPSYDEQVEIVNYLQIKIKEIDALKKQKEIFLNEMESYKKSVIYEYVTGKKEI